MPHFLWVVECYTSAKCELLEIREAKFFLAETALIPIEIEVICLSTFRTFILLQDRHLQLIT
jgi:hypothetical protein